VALSPKLKVIAFDADDTLWMNEPYFERQRNLTGWKGILI
jgi:hypothetical protein